jgi:hypothetical protein
MIDFKQYPYYKKFIFMHESVKSHGVVDTMDKKHRKAHEKLAFQLLFCAFLPHYQR